MLILNVVEVGFAKYGYSLRLSGLSAVAGKEVSVGGLCLSCEELGRHWTPGILINIAVCGGWEVSVIMAGRR